MTTTVKRALRITGALEVMRRMTAAGRIDRTVWGMAKNALSAWPSTCISANRRPPSPWTVIMVGGKTPGTLAEAISTSANSARACGPPRAAIAPMSQTISCSVSRLVVATSRRRPLACSAATLLSSSSVT